MTKYIARCLLLLSSVVLVAKPSFAVERVFLGDMVDKSVTVARSGAVANRLQSLRGRAANQGTVRVIVGVRAAFAPEGRLSRELAAEQRGDIDRAQSSVLQQLPISSAQKGQPKRFSSIPFMALEVDQDEFDALVADPNVTSIQEDRLSRPLLAESVPLIGAANAWASSYTGSGQTIAILDTGVDKTHPFLLNKVVSEACYSRTVVGDAATSLCPGGASSSTDPGSGANCGTTSTITNCDHGTRVAGVAAGNGASSGVAKGANIISIQVFSEVASEAICGSSTHCLMSYEGDQLAALARVYDLRNTYNIAAINISFGKKRSTQTGDVPYSDQSICDSENTAMKASIDNLRSAGIATVVASGNDGATNGMLSPACISSAVSVGATSDVAGLSSTLGCTNNPASVDKVACYSNSATFLNLLAPGSQINTSTPGTGYANTHGTSMAAPHVAGAFALLNQLMASPTTGKNTLSVDAALAALTSTGVLVTDARNSTTKPRIQVDAALSQIGAPVANTIQISSVNPASIREGGTVTVTVTRTGYTANTASVNYATSNGTALAGSDYTAVSGTLNFAAGDTSKTFTVVTLKDTLVEADEFFNIALSGASGIGTALGTSSASVTITDTSGWKTSSGANAGWAAATDSTFGNPYSLKSATIANGQTAAIEVRGSFKAGNVSFNKRVSSESGKDFLYFYVDGVVKGSWSGESAWSAAGPYAVPAGAHTFKWEYKKDGSGSAGSDAAWIDGVTLPEKNVSIVPILMLLLE